MDHRNNHRRRPSYDRFLTTTTSSSLSSTTTTSPNSDDDFSEDDILFTSPTLTRTFSTTAAATNTTPKPPPPQPQPLRSQKSFKLERQPSGILAALSSPSLSPSPSRTISIIPQTAATSSDNRLQPFSLPAKFHQSAPMHVPIIPSFNKTRPQRRRHGSAFGFESIEDVDDDVANGEGNGEGDGGDGDMLPPHEMVARRLAQTPILSSSVLEGAGRTLKGRDLRQVRNAVFRHTGFID